MNNASELTTSKSDEEAHKVFYLFENVVNKSLPYCERAENIVAYLSKAVRFTLENASTEENKYYSLVKKVMLENSRPKRPNRDSERSSHPFNVMEKIF